MTKKQILKRGSAVLAVLLIICIVVAGILFFPLQGEKHVEIWSAGDEFDISKIQTVEKSRSDFKILMFTDTQLWSKLSDNAACYDEMDELVKRAQPDMIVLPGDNLSALASRFSINNFIKHMESYEIPLATALRV